MDFDRPVRELSASAEGLEKKADGRPKVSKREADALQKQAEN